MRSSQLLMGNQLAALTALVADVGDPCWVGGVTAAALYGFDGFDLRPPFHITTARDRNVRRIGHIVHTTTEIPLIDRDIKFTLPVLSATRTLIDISRSITPAALTTALDSAVRDGLTSEDFLHRRINALRRSGRSGLASLLAILEGAEITRGGQSWLEREVLRLLAAHDLPRPSTQVVLGRRGDRLIRVDFVFPGTPIVVEALGYRWHRTDAQMRIDAERFNQLLIDGFVPLQFTYSQVVEDPAFVIDTIRTALQRWAPDVPVRT